jgi:hypothetical protein
LSQPELINRVRDVEIKVSENPQVSLRVHVNLKDAHFKIDKNYYG